MISLRSVITTGISAGAMGLSLAWVALPGSVNTESEKPIESTVATIASDNPAPAAHETLALAPDAPQASGPRVISPGGMATVINGRSAVAAAAVGQTPQVNGAKVETVDVHVGQSVVISAPWPVQRVSITQTDIADVEVLTPTEVLLIGNQLGTTDMILWGDREQVWHVRVDVRIDLSHIRDELNRIFPDCELEVMQSRDVLVVGGSLRRVEQVDQLRGTLDSYGIKYVDQSSVAGVQQVALKVRVAEVSRRAIRALGVNAVSAGSDFFGGITVGPDGGGPLNPISIGTPVGSGVGNVPFSFVEDLGVSSGISLFAGFPGADLELFIQALAENQYLRVLAEPTLVALSGEEASFLAGGEFPIPIVQGSSVGAGTSITIEYKEFGVRLNFIPHVLGDDRIRLYVAPEVSDLSEMGAVEIEGFRVPSVLTRRAETTLEMNSGQSFAMAGLLNQKTNARSTRVPVLGDLPVIGPLFRSVRYQSSETELVVMVTASLVEPISPNANFPIPGDLQVRPNDWELYVDGQLNGRPAALAPADASWLKEQGLDRLEGPGAWSRHDQAPGRSEVERRSDALNRP